MDSKIKKITLLLTVLFSVVSCENYLDEQPTTLIDADYIYVCIATNTWVRTQLTTWGAP